MKSRLAAVLVVTLFFAFIFPACMGDDESDENGNVEGTTSPIDGVTCREGEAHCSVTGTITDNFTFTADKQWLLKGGVFIGDDVNETILTIEAGTTVFGESATQGMLVVRRNSKIIAEGTKDAPIVFTSSKNVGERARGDWGGLIINGNAPVNSCGDDYEGDFCEAFGEGGTGWYGGTDPADNSGTLKYVRVEFAGHIISPDNELNGIAFQGVGSGTTVEYVQVHMNKDDGIEMFGGNVNIKYALVTGVADDCFDWTDGWQGNAQFIILQQAEGAGDQGIEADNNGEDNAATPRSNPSLANFTIIGSPDSDKSDIGILLREGTGAHISNFIVDGFNDACFDIDHGETYDNIDSAEGIDIDNTILNCASNFKKDDEDFDEDEVDDPDPIDIETWFSEQGNLLADAELVNPFDFASPDYGTPASSVAAGIGSVDFGGFFEAVDYAGAIEPDGEDWTAGWTTHDEN